MTDDARPRARRPFLTAEWRHLVMLSYEVDLDVLAPLVPTGLALDLWHGRALVSVVGFRFLDARVLGAAIPRHRDFDEVNLRSTSAATCQAARHGTASCSCASSCRASPLRSWPGSPITNRTAPRGCAAQRRAARATRRGGSRTSGGSAARGRGRPGRRGERRRSAGEVW